MLYYNLYFRTGKAGTLIIDGINRVEGESRGNLEMLNVDGNIYLGKSDTLGTYLNIISKERRNNFR